MEANREEIIKKISCSYDDARNFVDLKSFEYYFEKIAEEKRICIFGGGALGKQIGEWLLKTGIMPSYFCDNDENMANLLLNGRIPYISFQELQIIKDSVYIIVAVGNRASNDTINKQLCMFPYVWQNPLGITVYWSQVFNTSKREFSEMAADVCIRRYYEEEYSVQLFQKLLRLRMQHEITDYDTDTLEGFCSEKQYIARDLIDYTILGTYVDCGAFTGDSLDEFIKLGTCAEYYLFEMDEVLRCQLEEHVGAFDKDLQSRVYIYPYGVGEKQGKVYYTSDLTGGSKVADLEEHEAEIISLDEVCFRKKIDFIKMDIEGMEEKALIGAKNLILRDHPVLAISAYHNLAQFVRIPILIRELFPGYKLYLRHYKYTIDDTVCYAVYEKNN